MQEKQVWFLHQENPLEKEMATYTSIVAWEISCKKQSDGPQSLRLQRVGHDLVTEDAHIYYFNGKKFICTNLCNCR